MHITPTQRTIIEYSLTLSAEDAQLALADPFSFEEKIREQLLPHLPGAAETNGKRNRAYSPGWDHPAQAQKQAGRGGRRNGRKASAKSAAPKAVGRGRGKSTEKAPCPECGKQIARKFLPLHLKSKHGAEPGGSMTTPPATASASAESA